MSVLAFFEWCEATWLGVAVRSTEWLFPVIEATHLVAFAVIGGVVLLVDLRLFGLALREQRTCDLAREAQPWLVGSLVVMFVSGGLLFVSEAVKCYYSNPFWIKMSALALAIAFTFTVKQRVVRVDDLEIAPALRRCVAALSIVVWGTVAWGGRWIGFSG